MEKKFTAGVIGAGRMGKIHIKNIVRHIPEIKLKTVADIKTDAQLKEWIKDMGVPNLIQDANDIFDDPEINVVIIASSTTTHVEFIQKVGGGDFATIATWPYFQNTGSIIRLDGNTSDKARTIVQDDLRALSKMEVVYQGHFELIE